MSGWRLLWLRRRRSESGKQKWAAILAAILADISYALAGLSPPLAIPGLPGSGLSTC